MPKILSRGQIPIPDYLGTIRREQKGAREAAMDELKQATQAVEMRQKVFDLMSDQKYKGREREAGIGLTKGQTDYYGRYHDEKKNLQEDKQVHEAEQNRLQREHEQEAQRRLFEQQGGLATDRRVHELDMMRREKALEEIAARKAADRAPSLEEYASLARFVINPNTRPDWTEEQIKQGQAKLADEYLRMEHAPTTTGGDTPAESALDQDKVYTSLRDDLANQYLNDFSAKLVYQNVKSIAEIPEKTEGWGEVQRRLRAQVEKELYDARVAGRVPSLALIVATVYEQFWLGPNKRWYDLTEIPYPGDYDPALYGGKRPFMNASTIRDWIENGVPQPDGTRQKMDEEDILVNLGVIPDSYGRKHQTPHGQFMGGP